MVDLPLIRPDDCGVGGIHDPVESLLDLAVKVGNLAFDDVNDFASLRFTRTPSVAEHRCSHRHKLWCGFEGFDDLALAPNLRPPGAGKSGLFHTGGPDVPAGLMSDDGTLYPIALW
ncbi:MAG: hypothetical protein QNJ44_20490, partial [Rhodobacter sp.]|nr:hypothetical protein [Rhodobacter sp.]